MTDSPQKENGYTPIANEIMEALVGARLNGSEMAIILYVMRRTYGYGKKEDWISYTQFEKALGIARKNVWRNIESLVTKRLLVTEKKLGKTIYRFNKHYTGWVVTKMPLVTKMKSASYENEVQLVTKMPLTKESITKENKKESTKEKNFSFTPSQIARQFFHLPMPRQKVVADLVEAGCDSLTAEAEVQKFIDYWTEPNKSGTRQRWETEKTFEVGRRLKTWFRNIEKFNPSLSKHYVA